MRQDHDFPVRRVMPKNSPFMTSWNVCGATSMMPTVSTRCPRADFPPDMELEEGLVIGFDTPTGEELSGIVLEAEEDTVKVDFNHPLAGREITFEVEILSVD
ncbi:MAG: hypothetical protein AAES65_00980 [Candidatus Thiodiazotropha sp. (ex. Lucinoma kazani)]